MRYAMAALFVLLFLGFHILMFLITRAAGSQAVIPVPPAVLLGLALLGLAICALLMLLLVFGIGARNGMSRWRTPLSCILVLFWCLLAGGMVAYQTSGKSGDELLRLMESKGFSKSDVLYQDIEAAIDRDQKMAFGSYGLLGLGALSGVGALVSLFVARRKQAVAPLTE